jgi:hypothetical protein
MVRRGEIDNLQSLGTAIYTRPMVRRRAKSLKALVFELPEDTPDDELPGRPRGPSSDRPPFLPISADYRVGGRFQFEGNAGGRDPRLLKAAPVRVTWVYGKVKWQRRGPLRVHRGVLEFVCLQ